MLRAINNFNRQIRVPVLGKDKHKSAHLALSQAAHSPSTINGLGFDFQKSMADSKNRFMSSEQMISWYGKVLESVKARYRKLQRFTR